MNRVDALYFAMDQIGMGIECGAEDHYRIPAEEAMDILDKMAESIKRTDHRRAFRRVVRARRLASEKD